MLAALTLLVLAAAAAAAPAAASAQAAAPPGSATLTTTLLPGWRMVAWLGPDATVAELFNAIPALERVSIWDAASQHYGSWPRGGVPRDGRTRLTAGTGVWLRLGGEAPFAWTRPAASSGVLLSLHAGRNLVGWLGEDGAAVEEVLARFGDGLVGASAWDASSRRFLHYRPGAPPAVNTLATLRRGDGLLIELAGDGRWWQGGASGVEFQFPGGVPDDLEGRVRAEMASVLAFFAERYGIEPPPFTMELDLERERSAAGSGRIYLTDGDAAGDRLGGVLAHEYFHILQAHFGQGGPADGFSPQWMTEGSATYAAGLYQRGAAGGVAPEILHRGRWAHAAGVPDPLERLEDGDLFYDRGSAAYSMGAVAIEWLAAHAAAAPGIDFNPADTGWTATLADAGVHIDYYRLLGSAGDWTEAFERAFGLAPGDFYGRFAGYRTVLLHLSRPHLADEVDQPVVVVSGEVPIEAVGALRDQLALLQSLFADRLGGVAVDYTVHLAGDHRSAAAAAGWEPGPFCMNRSFAPRPVLVVNVQCPNRLVWDVALLHVEHVTERLAPRASLPDADGSRGPEWLLMGTRSYVGHMVQAALGQRTMNDIRSQRWASVRVPAGALAGIRTLDDVLAAPPGYADALSYLAVVWLAERAGEAALMEYYRQLPASAGWQGAFEAAFGMTVGDFHDAFEADRAGAGPPVLHPVRAWVRDRGGNPAPGVVVVASRDGLLQEDVAASGRDGSFELDLRDGRYQLSVNPALTTCSIPGRDRHHPGGVIVISGSPRIFLIRLPEGSACPPITTP